MKGAPGQLGSYSTNELGVVGFSFCVERCPAVTGTAVASAVNNGLTQLISALITLLFVTTSVVFVERLVVGLSPGTSVTLVWSRLPEVDFTPMDSRVNSLREVVASSK